MTKPKATRQAFGEMLAELGATNSKVVAFDADLSKSTKTDFFAKKFPERFYDMGIAEANMIGTAAGMALSGYVPFLCSFGAFVTGRYDQIRMSVGYAGANVRIIGTHAGVGIGDDGHSQMGLEDLSLMREIPGMMVLQPADEIETRQMIAYLANEHQGPAYVRLTRQNVMAVHNDSYAWKPGKLDILKSAPSGSRDRKVALLSTGATVQEAVSAHAKLEAQGIAVTLVNVHTLKPFDVSGIAKLAQDHAQLVTVEDHYTTGGLGSAVAELLACNPGNSQNRLTRLGIQDVAGESGEPIELYEKHGISAAKISETIAKLFR